MSVLRALFAFLVLALGAASPARADDRGWEIERNFRYFKYDSDVALQRIAFDLASAALKHAPTAGELEGFLNAPGFWESARLVDADADARAAWPLAWREGAPEIVYDLIKQLRGEKEEQARPKMAPPEQLDRQGWASLLVRATDKDHPDGWTDTCWDSYTRQHSNCAGKGDYVRPAGWIVRVYDNAAPADKSCLWSAPAGTYLGQISETDFYDPKLRPAIAWPTDVQDCREARVFVPAGDADQDPHKVHGDLTVTRTRNGVAEQWRLTPWDALIVGFADSFGSGEGNPERGATFSPDGYIAATNLPARPTDQAAPDMRAQWTDRRCHRSVYSWQIRSALYAALVDRHRSVTVLPYGCSGAEVFSGMLYPYKGIEDVARSKRAIGHSAQLGLAYQELCKSYTPAQKLPREPNWQTDANLLSFKANAAESSEVADYLKTALVRCAPGEAAAPFKRDVDALLLIAGINDFGFRSWATRAIAPDSLNGFLGGFMPSFTDPAVAAKTEALHERLAFRYAMLREALDEHFLVDAGLIDSRAAANSLTLPQVIVPFYPRALDDGRAGGEADHPSLCTHGNEGMDVGVLTDSLSLFGGGAKRCEASGAPLPTHGVIMAIQKAEYVEAIEQFRAEHLDGDADHLEGLTAFAAATDTRPGYSLIQGPGLAEGPFGGRGFCASSDAASHIQETGHCLSLADFLKPPAPPCANVAESPDMHADCIAASAEALPIARYYSPAFHAALPPDQPENWAPVAPESANVQSWSVFAPYAHRTRLFRTPNDAYLIVNQRPSSYTDQTVPGLLDLVRANGGAFHPTAEAHAIVATFASAQLHAVLSARAPAAP
jgi:hypothetical protein